MTLPVRFRSLASRRLRAFALLLVAFALVTPLPAAPAAAQVVDLSLVLDHLGVDVRVTDAFAVTRIDATYENPHPEQVEGRVQFVVARSAVLTAFQLTVDNETFHGVVQERVQAQRTYDEAVEKGEHAVLLTSAGRGQLSFQINVPANATATVSAVFAEIVPLRGGVQSYSFPLDRFGEVASLQVDVTARSTHGWSEGTLSGLPFETLPAPDGSLAWSFAGEDVTVDEAIRLVLTPQPGGYRSTAIISGTDEDAAGIFTILPPGSDEPPIPLDIVLVIDVSGSMNPGGKLTQARTSLHTVLDQLRPADRFALVSFSTDVDVHRNALEQPQGEALEAAHDWVDALVAAGWTNISGAMDEALKILDAHHEEGRLPVVVLVTDGVANRGISDKGQIVEAVSAWNTMDARVHTVGIGFDQDDAFLNELAAANRGHYQGMQRDEDASVALADFVERVSSPLLKDITVLFPGLGATEMHPTPLPDLYGAGHLVVAARIDASKMPHEVKVTVHAEDADGPVTMDLVIPAADVVIAPEALQLWARQKASTLERRLELDPRGEHAEGTRAALVKLGVTYQVETSQTAWVVVATALDEAGLPVDPPTLPAGGDPTAWQGIPPPSDAVDPVDPVDAIDSGDPVRRGGTGAPASGADDDHAEDQDTPAPGLLALALVGVLFGWAARRRRSA